MKIFFDHQTFSQQTYGGISRYYAELITGINSTADNDAYLPLLVSNNVHLREMGIPTKSYFADTKIPKKLQTICLLNEFYTIGKLYQKSYDVFHATYYDPYFIPYLKGRPFVITFLDMIHEKFGSQYSELVYDGVITKHKRLMADRAERIIAISESTKNDLVELLNINPSKIEVIYLGSSLVTKPRELVEEFAAIPYLLFVGNRSMYKNFSGFLAAIHPLLHKYKIRLLCAGGGQFTKNEREFVRSLNVDGYVEQLAINDQILSTLYQNAVAFVFPSLYEGFGIPVLEAFSCGCPCIVSNVSSLPEVAGEAAFYMDPHSPESMAHAVEQLLIDSELRKTLVLNGYERLSLFSWKRAVDETLDLYRAIT